MSLSPKKLKSQNPSVSIQPKTEYKFEHLDRHNYDRLPELGETIQVTVTDAIPFPHVRGEFLENLSVLVTLAIGLPYVGRGGWKKYQAVASFSNNLHYHAFVYFRDNGGVFSITDDEQIQDFSRSE